jgi:hypothetical protein
MERVRPISLVAIFIDRAYPEIVRCKNKIIKDIRLPPYILSVILQDGKFSVLCNLDAIPACSLNV